MSVVYLGTDPEFVILNEDGAPVPAHTVFPDFTKEKKWQSGKNKPDTKLGAVRAFRDGYNLEFNLTRGHTCRAQMLQTLRDGMLEFRALLPKGLTLGALPAYEVNLADLLLAPEDVREFGCDPSYDAYTNKANKVEIDAMTHPYRYAGGHLHFTTHGITAIEKLRNKPRDPNTGLYPAPHEILESTPYTAQQTPMWDVLSNPENHAKIIKLMDLYVGLPLSLIFNSKATFLRRRYYGKAGEFRPQNHPGADSSYVQLPSDRKDYVDPINARTPKFLVRQLLAYKGVEYRTPGPEIFTHPAIAALAMATGRWIIQNFAALEKKWDKSIEDELREAINEGKGGERLLQRVAGLYDADVVKALRNKAFWNATTANSFIDLSHTMNYTWPEYPTEKWGIKVPAKPTYDYATGKMGVDTSTFVEIPKRLEVA